MKRIAFFSALALFLVGLAVFVPGRMYAEQAHPCSTSITCSNGSCSCSSTNGTCKSACSGLGNPACQCTDP